MFSDFGESLASAGSTFAVIALAEMGDKTQLVCMTLSLRHRAMPVFAGAALAFALLNVIAVAVGAALSDWIPEKALNIIVAVLFGAFGIWALKSRADDRQPEIRARSGRNVLAIAFAMIFISEMGDKTQIAVAGLSSTADPGAVWVGATLALAATSALGVLAGRTVLQRVPIVWLHRLSGVIFLGLATYSLIEAFTA